MRNRIAIGFASAMFVLAIVFRISVSGWGPPADIPATTATHFGLAAYPADNLSYVSWAQQANDGRWLFDILYTTTDHARLFFNPLFLGIGKTASIIGVSPMLVLNVVALFSLPVVILSIWSMCKSLRLGSSAAFVATCLAIGGGGISWLRKILEWSTLDRVIPVGPTGPDLYFYDVYPVVAYFIAPYHAISLAFLAALAALIVRFDDDDRPLTAGAVVSVVSLGALVAGVRPHTAIMVLVAYAAATAITWAFAQRRTLLARRLTIAAWLAASMIPLVLYSVWVAQQAVWNDYARMHRPETNDWLVGFLLLWVLGTIGAVFTGGRRLIGSAFAFPIAWSLGAGVLLLVLNGFIFPKLTYGFTMALALLAGVTIDRARDLVPSRVVRGLTVAAIAVLSVASPLIMMNQFVLNQGAVAPSEFFQVVRTIRSNASSPFPSVLTDCETGVLLPGLGGSRVFCGHWALTDGNRPKIVLLSRLGFLPENESIPSFSNVGEVDVQFRATQLRKQIDGNTFQYLVVKKRDRLYRLVAAQSQCALADGTQYAVLKMCPEIKALLAGAVAAEMSEHTPLQSKS
jgi:hypothetical protein